MKVRQRKYAIYNMYAVRALMCFFQPAKGQVLFCNGTTKDDPRRVDNFIPEPGKVLVAEDPVISIDWAAIQARQAQRVLVEESEKWVVRRKKDQVIVGEFDTLGEAQALIDKAKASKKAALELV